MSNANALADQLDQQDSHDQNVSLDRDNLTKTVTGLCDTLDIKRFYEGSLKGNSTTAKDIFDALNLESSRVSLAKRNYQRCTGQFRSVETVRR